MPKTKVRYVGLDVHRDSIAIAVAHELAGFSWAIGQERRPTAA